jgi:hypothetical protein
MENNSKTVKRILIYVWSFALVVGVLIMMKHTIDYMMNSPKIGGLGFIGLVEHKGDHFEIEYLTEEEQLNLQK